MTKINLSKERSEDEGFRDNRIPFSQIHLPHQKFRPLQVPTPTDEPKVFFPLTQFWSPTHP